MKVAVASDHRGYQVKAKILMVVNDLGHEAIDAGPHDSTSVDYPDLGNLGAQMVFRGEVERAILICGTGIGMCIVANKVPGVRAALCHDDVTAEMSRRHNDANVLCLSADLIGERLASRVVEIWMTTDFEGGRHQRRLDKITAIENNPKTRP